MSPGHAGELDPLEPVLQSHGSVDSQEPDLHPIRAARTHTVGQVLAVLRERVT